MTPGASSPAPETPAAMSDAEAVLWRRWREEASSEARTALFDRFVPLALQIARASHFRQAVATVELSDLRQWAMAGLLEAIDRFDPDRGAPFAAFARPRIRGSVLDGLSRSSERNAHASTRSRLRRARVDDLTDDTAPLSAEDALDRFIALTVGLAVGFMLDGAQLCEGGDVVDAAPNAYQSVVWKETVGRLADAVATLPAQEQAIVRYHYGADLDFSEIARLLDVSRGRVSQAHRSALERLRRRLRRLDTPLEDPP